jgi:CHAT domain-containing protein
VSRFCVALLALAYCASASGAGVRELPQLDPARDRAVLTALVSLSQAMLGARFMHDNTMAIDYFVPCLPYADERTGQEAQKLIREQVNIDARGRKLGVLGKLDHHGAYKGRDRLRNITLDASIELLSDPPPGRERAYGFVRLCALTTRFEHANVDYDAAANEFVAAYEKLADGTELFDLPLMHALAGAEFWRSPTARAKVSALGAKRARSVAGGDAVRMAVLLAYAALAAPTDEEFMQLASRAEQVAGQVGAPAVTMVRAMIYHRYMHLAPPKAIVQLGLARDIFSTGPVPPALAQRLHPDHVDRTIERVIQVYLSLPPDASPVDVNDAEWEQLLAISDLVQLLFEHIRRPESRDQIPRPGQPISKRAVYLQYQALDFNRFTGRSRESVERRLQASSQLPRSYGRVVAEQVYNTPDIFNANTLAVYNPAYRERLKYLPMRNIGYALELYDRTGNEAYMAVALHAVQVTFVNLSDLSRRWMRVRAMARNASEDRLVATAQTNMFAFENELFALAQEIIDIPPDPGRETLLRLDALEKQYQRLTHDFHNRHATYAEITRRMPAAEPVLRGQFPTLDDIRQFMGQDEAIVYMVRVDDEYLSFLIRKQDVGVSLDRRPFEDVDALVDRLVENLVPQPGGRGYAPFDRVSARALYDFTLGPFDEQIKDVRRLVWIGPDALAGLSPAVFVDPRDTLVFDRMSVTLSASLANFFEARYERATRKRDEFAVLGVGASQSSATEIACLVRGECPPTGGGRFRSAGNGSLLDLAPLPETATELVAMQRALEPVKATLLLGPEARVDRVQAALQHRHDVVSFATHGVGAHRLESVGLIEPALLLGPPSEGRRSFLSASEIATLRLSGRPIVVLSACDTTRAGNGSMHFDALSGFYQAFRLAGAEGMVATQWEVASDAAARLVPDYVSRIRKGAPFAEALRDAALQLRDSLPSALQHPGYWAPFVYLGDGTATWGSLE